MGLNLMILVPVAALLVSGCSKPEQPSPPPAQTPQSKVVLATHWIGKARLALDPNAAYQMELWNLPESVRLEEQTLDKLARALPRLLGISSGGDTNALTGVIRPLLDDLVQAESFTEVRVTGNLATEFALAVRLSPERLALWQTNIATLIQVLTNHSHPEPMAAPKNLQFSGVEGWILIGFRGSEPAAPAVSSTPPESVPTSDQNVLFAEFVQRFESPDPPAGNTTNLWLEVNADLNHLVRSNSILAGANLPFVRLTHSGESQNVRTRGELTFLEPLESKLEPWNIPTNLIYDPLVSFTAIRGVKSLVESSALWRGLQAGEAPDQVYAWALRGIPSQSYFAAIWPDSSNRFEYLSDRIVQALDAFVVSDGLGKPGRMTNTSGVVWTGNPFAQPFLQRKTDAAGEMVSGGFSALPPAGQPIPSVLLDQFRSQTNVLYYDWELAESRTAGWLYLGQLLRFATGKSQLGSNSAGLRWLQAVGPKLGNVATIVHQTAPNKLTVSRTSTAGFTGIEFQGLMDWIESPNFPHGLQSLSSLPDPRLYKTARQMDKPSNDPSVRPVIPR